MRKSHDSRLKLAHKFYLLLVLPLIFVSSLVTWVTYQSLDSNAADLANALRIQGKANRLLPLLLVQDDSSKAILIEPGQLEFFSTKKIAAYDEHKALILELKAESTKEPKYASMLTLINQLSALDESKLRPIDSAILELLFEDPIKARAQYFTEYEPPRLEYEKGIRELTQIGNQLAEAASIEMTRKNTASLLQVSLALVLGIIVVATTITILSRQVERSDENTKSLLAVLNEGLFFFDKNGLIADERSQSLAKIVPGSDSIKSIFEFTKNYSGTAEQNVKTCLQLLWDDDDSGFLSDFDSTITFLPSALTIQDRTIELEYRPLRNDKSQLEKVVVVATDATDRLKNKKEAMTQAERVQKISRVAASLDSYRNFLEEAVSLFKRADRSISGTQSEQLLPQIKRDLHTLKGSIGMFEFKSLAGEIHHAETLLADHGVANPKFREQWERIKHEWRSETSDIEKVLRLEDSKDKIQIQKNKFARLVEHAREKSDADLETLLTQCQQIPASEAFSRYKAYIEKASQTDSNKQVKFVVATDCSDVSFDEIQRLDGALTHLIRNSMDHGIEDQTMRAERQKPLVGSIQIGCYRFKTGGIQIVIKDDGQGINGDLLARKAVEKGLWTAEQSQLSSYKEKIELIFVPNLSTKEEITESSGRGVGMDAVKSLIAELGGTMTIDSQIGVGTQFKIEVPALAAGQPKGLLAA